MTPRRNSSLSLVLMAAAFGLPCFDDFRAARGPSPADPVPPVFPKDPQQAMDAAATKRRLRAERKAGNARRSAAGKNH